MRPVLFIDIDGVLNCEGMDWEKHHMQPELVARMNDLVEKTDAYVVLSSTWRQDPGWRETMQKNGLDFEFLDRTPRLRGPRGKEIYLWLSRNRDLKNYAILDDDSDMLALQKSHFFQTDFRYGLTQEIADKVAAYLLGDK